MSIPEPREVLVVEVDGRRLEVTVPGIIGANSGATAAAPKRVKAAKKSAASGDAVEAPMQGNIIKVAVTNGAVVAAGDLVIVLEAMKMEQPITAHKAGTVKNISAEVGTTVPSGTVLLEIAD